VESASRYEELENVVIASWNVDTGKVPRPGQEQAYEATNGTQKLPLR
jgi:hypothetical protein